MRSPFFSNSASGGSSAGAMLQSPGMPASEQPVGDRALKLCGHIPSAGADFLQRLQPRQFGLDAFQLATFGDHLRRQLRQTEAAFFSARAVA